MNGYADAARAYNFLEEAEAGLDFVVLYKEDGVETDVNAAKIYKVSPNLKKHFPVTEGQSFEAFAKLLNNQITFSYPETTPPAKAQILESGWGYQIYVKPAVLTRAEGGAKSKLPDVISILGGKVLVHVLTLAVAMLAAAAEWAGEIDFNAMLSTRPEVVSVNAASLMKQTYESIPDYLGAHGVFYYQANKDCSNPELVYGYVPDQSQVSLNPSSHFLADWKLFEGHGQDGVFVLRSDAQSAAISALKQSGLTQYIVASEGSTCPSGHVMTASFLSDLSEFSESQVVAILKKSLATIKASD